MTSLVQETVRIKTGGVALEGDLALPDGARGMVVFAHGSGSHSGRNRFLAEQLQGRGLATLLLDLLTPEEEAIDEHTEHLRFDIELLAIRLSNAASWAAGRPETRDLPIGYFAADTGAAAALMAAARYPNAVAAIVSRSGRPDLAGSALGRVRAPTLLIAGGADTVVVELNVKAYDQLRCARGMNVVRGASHLFEEPGALETVAAQAAQWFARWLPARDPKQEDHIYESG
jgi:alpha-beta hydrolase superfamily lysophospholipase